MSGPRPFVGAIGVELLDGSEKRIAANFVNLVVRRGAPQPDSTGKGATADRPETVVSSPRGEVLGPRQVALPFGPPDFASFEGQSLGDSLGHASKVYFYGSGSVEYRLRLPDFAWDAGPKQLALLLELASKARDERLDWPARRNPLDYPQTDTRKHP